MFLSRWNITGNRFAARSGTCLLLRFVRACSARRHVTVRLTNSALIVDYLIRVPLNSRRYRASSDRDFYG
jgi:hypothetical protein